MLWRAPCSRLCFVGFAFARLCNIRGAKVLIGDLKLVPAAQEYLASANDMHFQQCDVSHWQSLHDLISSSVNTFGDVPDVYVPSAGLFEPPSSNFWDDTEVDSYKTIQINVNHPIKFTRLAMRALAGAEKQGVVCLLSSTAGLGGHYLANLYTASKHAVLGFAKSMGQADVDEGVKIICVLPGLVQTPLWEDREDDPAAWEQYLKMLKSGLQPEDIANLMLKMIESREYGGGTCVLKVTKGEEHTQEEGFSKKAAKSNSDAKPEPDLKRIQSLMRAERGKKWT